MHSSQSTQPPFKHTVISLVLPALLTLPWTGLNSVAAAPLKDGIEKKSGAFPSSNQRDKFSTEKTKAFFSAKKTNAELDDEDTDSDKDTDGEPAEDAPNPVLETVLDPASLAIPMNGLMSTALQSALDRAAEWTEFKSGYRSVSLTHHNNDFPKPGRVKVLKVLERETQNGLEVIRLGLLSSRPDHPILWAQSFIKNGQTVKPANLHKSIINDIKGFISSETKIPEVSLSDLESEMIELSYADIDQAIYSLAAMGVSVFTGKKSGGDEEEKSSKDKKPSSPFSFGSSSSKSKKSKNKDDDEEDSGAMSPNSIPKSVPFNQLPMVFKVPSPPPASTSMIAADGEGGAGKGEKSAFGATTISSAGKLNPSTVSSRANQLLVMYHPEDPDSLSKVKKLLKQKVDVPARQIYIEGMVLEVSTTLLDQLGINFTRNSGTKTFTIGSATSGAANSLTYLKDTAAEVVDPRQLVDRLNALIREGKAELLSRPSILTLDNRQATIRVGTDIPIATSKSGGADGYGDVSFSFEYIQTGIQLNIRPRIETESSEVSMTIDTTVSETVPGADLEIRNSTGDSVLASAPTISSRSVQTYARLKNNTPLIIGGLVSKNSSTMKDSVPLIGKIPLIGDLLGYSSKNEIKREVIIVLTPYVLSETNKLPRVVPKDSDEFDLGKTTLFRESYRIRTEDVFDTRYIRTNARVRAYQALADKILLDHPKLKEKALFSNFSNDRVPGERALVHGMYYNLLDRLGIGKNIEINNFVFHANAPDGKLYKTNLEQVMKELGDGQTYQSFFHKNPGKALALTFTYHRNSIEQGLIRTETMPVISLVDCPDKDTWESAMQKMKGRNQDGLKYHTILIKDEGDIQRLRLTQAVKRTISVNDGDSTSTIDRFLTGRMVSIPVISKDHEQLLEASVAELYYDTALHYKALEGAIASVTNEIDALLMREDMQEYKTFLNNKLSTRK